MVSLKQESTSSTHYKTVGTTSAKQRISKIQLMFTILDAPQNYLNKLKVLHQTIYI